jgi:exodeoxyribonuclease VII small subunit
MKDKTLTYSEALAEISLIQQELEEGKISMEKLIEKVKRANFLLQFCKQQLGETEEVLKGIFPS